MKRYRYKITKAMSLLLILAGSLQIYGTAGSSDLGVLSLRESLLSCLIGIGIILFGIIIFGFSSLFERRYNKKVARNKRRRATCNKFIRDMAILEQ